VIRDSTFAENRTTEGQGGAIYNEGALSILNSTFYSNTATASTSSEGWGGAIVNYGALTVTHSSFISNTASYSGTTLYSSDGGGEGTSAVLYLYNNLIGGAHNGIAHCEGTVSANVNNLIEDGSCSPMLSGDPRVGSLGDNGGDTPTISLLFDSPAIDAGDTTSCAGDDQRGYARDDWACDLGAFEMQFTDGDMVSKTVASGGTYTFGPTLVRLHVEDDGGCLTGLRVQRVEMNHPTATTGIQTGRYWTLTPAGCSEGFTATLTLPLDVTPSSYDKACRWDTSSTTWDCGPHEDNQGSSDGPVAMPDIVARYPVTQLSDWAVGNNVGPTTVSLHTFSIAGGRAWLLALGLCVVTLLYVGWRRDSVSPSER
jgi:predicted outer membrane repeat protein